MASCKAPYHGISVIKNIPWKCIYILIGDYSYELLFEGNTGRWIFASELRLEGLGLEPRMLDPLVAYPRDLCKRIEEAAEFARAYYDIDVDDRVGIAAFDRWSPNPGEAH